MVHNLSVECDGLVNEHDRYLGSKEICGGIFRHYEDAKMPRGYDGIVDKLGWNN